MRRAQVQAVAVAGSPDNYVNSVASESSNKRYIGGTFTTFNGVSRNHLARLNSDGSLDTGFNIGAGFNDTVYAIAPQSDGLVLVGGWFTNFNGATQNYLVRLKSDGSRDSSFVASISQSINQSVNAIAIQSNNAIIVGGYFSYANGLPYSGLARFKSDGTLDTFNIGSGFNSGVRAIAIDSSGNILVGGEFTSFNGSAQNYLVRLTSGGTKDTSFNIGSGFDAGVRAIAVQSDGKILVGGWFTTFNGAAQNYLVRLNSNGSKDTSFNMGSGFNTNAAYQVESIIVRPDNKIIVGGTFTSYNGVAQSGLVRLNSDGSLDTSFKIGAGFNNTVMSMSLQPDGNINIGSWSTVFGSLNTQYHVLLSAP
ncbi:MAG: hypothetical protein ACXVLQ_15705 [Bacteriovorax sp.]